MENNTMYQRASATSVLEVNKVLRNTYALLAMTLMFSALMAGVAMMSGVGFINPFVMLAGFYGLLFLTHKTQDSAFGVVSVFALTGFMGFTLGPILSMYLGAGMGDIVMMAFGGTAVIFFALSGYVLTTKKDMSFLGGMLVALTVVVLIGMVANLFLAIPALSLAMSAMFMLLSSGLILYKTSEIIHGGETNYISATVTLFVSLYNIFISLLNILTALTGGDD